MKVLKFGGTSLAHADAMHRIVGIVVREGGTRIVVASALAGVTDALLGAAARAREDAASGAQTLDDLLARHQLIAEGIRHPALRRDTLAALDSIAGSTRAALDAIGASRGTVVPPAAIDGMLAAGELWSSRLLAALLQDAGLAVRWIDARDVIRTDGRHQSAAPDIEAIRRRVDRVLYPALSSGHIVVLGGFIGSGPDGATTTLGRGGSDYSATLLGESLRADEIQIWTDVDGVFTADPRLFPQARTIERLSYAEAHDLATFGAKVLHPSTILPAARRNIPIRVLNSRQPAARGTLIAPADGSSNDSPLTAATYRPSIALLEIVPRTRATLPRLPRLPRLVDELARRDAQVVLAEGSEERIAVALTSVGDLQVISAAARPYGDVTVRGGLAIVCAVGGGWRVENGPACSLRALLDDIPVHLVSRPSLTAPFAVVVDEQDAIAATARLHDGWRSQHLRAAVAG
jgi:aspartate kinase